MNLQLSPLTVPAEWMLSGFCDSRHHINGLSFCAGSEILAHRSNHIPHWLIIALAIVFWFFALAQVRVYFIYTRRIESPTIGPIDGGPTLRAIAIRSAVVCTIYGILVLLIPWPKLLTYVSIVWVCKEMVDAVLGWVGKGVHGVVAAMMTDKGRRHYVIVQAVAVLSRAFLVLLCAHFFGF